jgi:hypothetical protein
MNPLHQCSVCSADFVSLRAFDQHILSKPSDPVFDCMTVSAMIEQGWEQDARGRWTTPTLKARAEEMREHYAEAA